MTDWLAKSQRGSKSLCQHKTIMWLGMALAVHVNLSVDNNSSCILLLITVNPHFSVKFPASVIGMNVIHLTCVSLSSSPSGIKAVSPSLLWPVVLCFEMISVYLPPSQIIFKCLTDSVLCWCLDWWNGPRLSFQTDWGFLYLCQSLQVLKLIVPMFMLAKNWHCP